jgi:hypothetical protein
MEDNKNPRQINRIPKYRKVGIGSRKTIRAESITKTNIRAVKGKTKLKVVLERAISQTIVLII